MPPSVDPAAFDWRLFLLPPLMNCLLMP